MIKATTKLRLQALAAFTYNLANVHKRDSKHYSPMRNDVSAATASPTHENNKCVQQSKHLALMVLVGDACLYYMHLNKT